MNWNQAKAMTLLVIPMATLLSLPVIGLAESIKERIQPSPESGFSTGGHGHYGDREELAFSPPGGSDAAVKDMQQAGISQDQISAIKALMQQNRTQAQALHQQLRQKKQAMMEYVKSPDAKEGQALHMLNDVNALERKVSELRMKTFFAMRSKLTPEQWQKMQTLREQQMQQRRQMHGGQNGFGGGPNGQGSGSGGSGFAPGGQNFSGGPGGFGGGFGPRRRMMQQRFGQQ